MNHKRYGSVAILAAASAGGAFMLSPGQTYAQGSASTMLEEVVVTARRREESLQDLPLSIAAFSAEQLAAQGLTNIEDVSDFVPNVTLTTADRANNTRIVIRGIGGGAPDPVEVFGAGMYIDGHYIPNSLGGYMSTMEIERIEVLRGPQGTLFGKNVTGGAVNIVSAKPGPEFESSLSMRLAEQGEQNIRGSVNIPLSDTVFTRIGLASEQFDGYYYNRHLGVDVGGKDGVTFNAALRWQPDDQWTFDVNSFLIRRRDGNAGIQCSDLGLPEGNAPNWGGASTEYPNGRINNLYPGADVDYHAACNGDYALSPFTNSQEKLTYSNIDQESIFASVQWDSDGAVGPFQALTVKGNASYRYNDYDYMQDRDASFLAIDAVGHFAGPQDVGQDNWTRGAEFLVEMQVNDRLEITAGVNYFYEEAKNGDGRCHALWTADPSNYAVLLDEDGAPILDGDGALQPANPGRYVECDTVSGLFFEIVPEPRTNGPTRSFMNTEYVENESLGIFAHATYALTDNWDLDVGARWTEDDRNFWNMEFSGLSDFVGNAECNTGVPVVGGQTLGEPITTGTTGLCSNVTLVADFYKTVGEGLFNSASKKFDDVTPMVSLTRNLNPGNVIEDGMVYFLYSEGFLTGGFNVELNANLPSATSLQSYDPENVANYEVGFKGTFADGRLRVNADVFFMDYTNKQAGVNIPNPEGLYGIDDPLGINQNVGQVDISGVEIEVRASPWDGGFISLDIGTLDNQYGSYQYVNPVPGDADACGEGDMSSDGTVCDLSNVTIVDLTADWTLNLGIEHTFTLASGATLSPRLNVYASDDIEYFQRKESDPQTPCTQDAYTKLGARLTYEPAAANWRASIYGENLTDEVIFESCGQSRGIWRYRHERPRWYGIEFSTRFGG
jgi:iron complex outermembrane receptor protein